MGGRSGEVKENSEQDTYRAPPKNAQGVIDL